jgi:hypothetical protein
VKRWPVSKTLANNNNKALIVADSKQGNKNIILEPGSKMQNREEKKICQISFYLLIEHLSNLSIFRTNNNK